MDTSIPPRRARLGFDPTYLPEFQNKLFIEGPLSARKYFNFFMLLGLATVIATYALLGASTASVIGAMIVAPLMGPIMATTAAVVMGSTHRALRGLGLTFAGIGFVIAMSFVLSGIMPDIAVSFVGNPELASRINPGLLALLTALGSGAAGAFITSRAEIADSIGGVAIAISLVPPLCVVGIALEQGQFEAAEGALLLFLTNYLAILLAGGITFWLLGLWRTAPNRGQKRVRQAGLVLFILGILVVAVPLTFTSFEALNQLLEDNSAYEAAEEWLQSATGYQLLAVDATEDGVEVTIEGSGDLPESLPLANALAQALERPVTVIIRTVPAEFVQSSTP
jgi:uncharacterized hydrophobic protein (TIGR00271 family)